MNISQKHSSWKSVPNEKISEWDKIFYSSQESLDISAPCPVCSAHTLHRYYQIGRPISLLIDGQHFVARGGCWQWCSTCRSYLHSSCFVPEWWSCDLVIDSSKLTAEPTALEKAYKEQRR